MTVDPTEGQAKQIPRVRMTAVFRRQFVVPGLEEVLPAGEYLLEAELAPGAVAPERGPERGNVLVHLHPTPGSPALARSLTLPLEELDRALARDKLTGRPLADHVLEQLLGEPMVRLFMASDGISDDDMRRVHSSVDPRPDGEAE